MKRFFIIGFFLLLVFVYVAADYLAVLPSFFPAFINKQTPEVTVVTDTQHTKESTSRDSTVVDYMVEPFVQGLTVPWSIVFTSASRMLVAERDGHIRIVENGVLLTEPMITFAVSNRSEEGLMGLALDPAYETNKYVYACYAYVSGTGIADRVVRLIDEGSRMRVDQTLLEDIPAARFHAGCRIAFGPDAKLYITTGDATQRQLAQDTQSLAGKILRINSDGTIPSDNPFPNSLVWSYGHRNPQGIDWYPLSGALWSTEHGPSGNDGPGGGDEVNVIIKGGNYGWPEVSHDRSKEGMVDPSVVYTPAVAPASGMFYTGTVFPQFRNNFFFGGLRGSGIYRVVANNDGTAVVSHSKLAGIDVGRVRDVLTGPDGYIYFSTSNRDGRGVIRDGDDKILRLVPKK